MRVNYPGVAVFAISKKCLCQISGITSQNYPEFESVRQSDQLVEDGLGGKGGTTECSLLAQLDLLGRFCFPYFFGWGFGIMCTVG